jgi:hypothetical protein
VSDISTEVSGSRATEQKARKCRVDAKGKKVQSGCVNKSKGVGNKSKGVGGVKASEFLFARRAAILNGVPKGSTRVLESLENR